MSAEGPVGTGSHAAGSARTDPVAAAAPARSVRRSLGVVTLAFESLVIVFAGLVAKDLSSLGTVAALGLAGALALACLLVAGLLRLRAGYLAGTALQVLIIAAGIWVPVMFFLGAVFAALWVVALRIGGRIDTERAVYRG